MARTNAKAATVSGISLLAVAAAFATNGEKLFAGMTAGWQWLMLVSSKTPLGILAFIGALAVGCGVMGLLRRVWPETATKSGMHGRLAAIEGLSVLAAFATGFTQEPTLMGGIFSLIAGLGVSIVYRVFAALGDLVVAKLSPTVDEGDSENVA